VVQITVPPLRERRDEIPLLTGHFLKLYSNRFGKNGLKPSLELMNLFMAYSWPGNVRELENAIQRLLVLEDEASITEELHSVMAEDTAFVKEDKGKIEKKGGSLSLKMMARRASEDIERKTILEALNHTNWNRKKAAELLNMKYKTLIYKINRLGLKN
jgi:DNA-binding NtrC family response regulator